MPTPGIFYFLTYTKCGSIFNTVKIVEHSHKTIGLEFDQPLSYTEGVDLNKRLGMEKFNNFTDPRSAIKGKTPHKAFYYNLRSQS